MEGKRLDARAWLADRRGVLSAAEHAQHLWTGAPHANAHQVGIAALVIEHKKQGLVAERCGTDLHSAYFREAIFDGNSQVARLLCLNEHLGGQLCELGRGHASEDVSIAGMGNDAAI